MANMEMTGVRFWIGMGLSFIFLLLAFYKVEWSKLGTVLMSVNFALLGVGVGIILLDVLVRALRWQRLLSPVGQLQLSDSFA